MASNYLNNLNNSIKINSSRISNAESKDALVALSKRNSEDLNRLADYTNLVLVPGLRALASKTRYPYDAVESGISGMTTVTYPEEQGNNRFNTELYWMKGPTEETGRPCTIKESFDYLLTNMIDRVVEIRESVTDLNPLLDQIVCFNRNLIRVATDTFGDKYVGALNCDTSATKGYPIAEHVYQIIEQLTGNSVADDLTTGVSDYPTLSIPGVAIATETVKGISEIASVIEIATGASIQDSDTGAELVISPSRLNLALSADDAGGVITGSTINSLRGQIKNIADERIAISDIGALANVDETNASAGKALVYDGNTWVADNINSTTLIGDRVNQPTIGDLENNLAMDNGISIAYDHFSEKNVKTLSYNTSGLNFNYFRSEDKDWTKDPGITISESLKKKNIPFVFKMGPSFDVFNQSTMVSANTGLLDLGNEINILKPSFSKPREVGFYQNTCSVWDTSSQTHTMYPQKTLGVCRSDLNYGKSWATEASGVLTGGVELNYNNFITTNNDSIVECIQETGSSKVMVLGPYFVGDRIWLCPGKILDMVGIPNNLGIAISDTFLTTSMRDLTSQVVEIEESLWDLLEREPSVTCVNTSVKFLVTSKPLGIISNKYNTGSNPETSKINALCYNLIEESYDVTGANSLRSYYNTEILEVNSNANLLSSEYISLSKEFTELSLPLVKLTL